MSGLFGRTRRSAPQRSRLATRDEAFRVLRSNVQVAISDLENPIVVVTSALPGEGKTSTCATLAQSIAAAGPRVVLVDLDLRHPDVHNRFGADNDIGVSNVLTGRENVEDCLQYVEVEPAGGLYLLPTGPTVPNPAELLGSPRTGRLLQVLAEQADIVLVDTPPVLPVADTLIIGRLAAGALMVVETGRAPIDAVAQAKAALTRNQTRILGLVLNRFDASGATGYGYGYGDELRTNGTPRPAGPRDGSADAPSSGSPSGSA